jgi:hypothetical protein
MARPPAGPSPSPSLSPDLYPVEPLDYDEETRRASFAIEDKRWARKEQLFDWLILGVMIVLSLSYHLIIFAVQPGLR